MTRPLSLAALLPRPALMLARGMALLLVGWLLLAPLARAEGVSLSHFSTERAEDGLLLSFSTRFELPKPVEEALSKGVPIYFQAEVSVFRNRWYWRDLRVAKQTRNWRLSYQPLTHQYRVSTGGLNQNFETLSEAVAAVRGASQWRLAEARELEDDGRYYLEFSYKLDTSQLPRPMQIGLGAPQGWALSVERNQGLNADFSLKTQP
ncbi:DUF4390 domain-containing protein [Paucibacter sp. APW11]|uniref:DUF4390 domain-containing protein n=1 Tax=Roseateles aquae TaxID=3077235 RepID=A0ABU3PAG0_9BURK|nr:DUF4390 domain-containing protein [Paucibacter sp. APW11]MDT8999561.1 DUF4390 domain-containing protein [Paucibacter sp. APW11]